MSSIAARISLRRPRVPALRVTSGISAIIVKELRGRMRGRRAFVVMTIHVLLLTLLAWMFQRLNEESLANSGQFGGQGSLPPYHRQRAGYAARSAARGDRRGADRVRSV